MEDPQFFVKDRIQVKIKVLEHGKDLPIPTYATNGSAGIDLRAAEDVVVPPAEELNSQGAAPVASIKTGIAIAVPFGYQAEVRPRSGNAFKKGITVINSPGTVDSDYRGEAFVGLVNHSGKPFEVKRGDRIAQMVFMPVIKANFEVVDELDQTDRGEGGFGSTGTR